MADHRPWRDVVNDLVEAHSHHGSAISMVHPVPEEAIEAFVVVNTCPDPLELEVPLKAKPVRRWLWNHRKARAFHRVGGLLWSASWGGRIRVGYGTLASKEAADRLTRPSRVEH